MKDLILGAHISLNEDLSKAFEILDIIQVFVTSPGTLRMPDFLHPFFQRYKPWAHVPLMIHGPYTGSFIHDYRDRRSRFLQNYTVKLINISMAMQFTLRFVIHLGVIPQGRSSKEAVYNIKMNLKELNKRIKHIKGDFKVCIENDSGCIGRSNVNTAIGIFYLMKHNKYPWLGSCYDCIKRQSRIETEAGDIEIQSLYAKYHRRETLPKAYTIKNGKRMLSPITFVGRRAAKEKYLYCITSKYANKLVASANELFYTERGPKKACELKSGDEVYSSFPISGLTDFQRQVLLGTLLGDAGLSKLPSGKIRLHIGHCKAQKEYLRVKYHIFRNLINQRVPNKEVTPKKDGSGKNVYYSFHSRTHPDLEKIYALCYRKGKHYLSKAWLRQLTAVGLAFWFFDDGSLMIYPTKKGPVSLFATISMVEHTDREVQNVIKMLRTKFNILAQVMGTTKGLCISFKQAEVEKLLNIVGKYCYSSDMLYKTRVSKIKELPFNAEQKRTLIPINVEKIRNTETWLYDLTVEGTHKYFAQHYLVHNTEHAFASGYPIDGWVGSALSADVIHLNAIPQHIIKGGCKDEHSKHLLKDSQCKKTLSEVIWAAKKQQIPLILERSGWDYITKDITYTHKLCRAFEDKTVNTLRRRTE